MTGYIDREGESVLPGEGSRIVGGCRRCRRPGRPGADGLCVVCRDEKATEGRNGKTCGPLYFEARTAAGHDDDIRAFAAGFATGLAEKVYLGACDAAMFRPAPMDYDWLIAKVRAIAEVYDLMVAEYHYPIGIGVTGSSEIWLLRDSDVHDAWGDLPRLAVNSPDWHRLRAQLCGIPDSEIDVRFHERRRAT